MRIDLYILISLFAIALLGCYFQDGGDLTPAVLFGFALAAFCFARKFTGKSLSFSAMTIPSFFLLGYLFILVLPAVLLLHTTQSEFKYHYLFALLLGLVCFSAGVWAANLGLIGRSPGMRKETDSHGIVRHDNDFRFILPFKLSLVIALLIISAFWILSEHIQLIDLLRGMPTSDNDRFEQIYLPPALQLLFELARRVILPICALYAFFMNRLYGGNWRLLFIAVFALSFFVAVLTLDRSPPLGLLAMLALAYFVANKGTGRVRWLIIAPIVVLALILGGIISIFQYQSEHISMDQVLATAWYVATERIFGSPFTMAIRAFELFNDKTMFLYGEYIRLFSVLPGRVYVESLDGIGPQYAAAPVTFIGDLWRNWGWPGVIIGTFSFGCVFQVIHISIFNKATIARTTIYVLLLLGSLQLLHGNAFGIVSSSIIFGGWLLGLAVCYIEDSPGPTRVAISHYSQLIKRPTRCLRQQPSKI